MVIYHDHGRLHKKSPTKQTKVMLRTHPIPIGHGKIRTGTFTIAKNAPSRLGRFTRIEITIVDRRFDRKVLKTKNSPFLDPVFMVVKRPKNDYRI